MQLTCDWREMLFGSLTVRVVQDKTESMVVD